MVTVNIDKRKKALNFFCHPDFQKEVIFGAMLEDLSAERSHLTGNTRLRFYMSLINKNLILHYYSIFKSYVKNDPNIINRKFNRLINS